MRIEFEVDGTPGLFERSNVTGRAVLRLGDESSTLASPWNPATHFAASTTRTWEARLGGHDFVVVKHRPQTLGGVRQAEFTVAVDGRELISARGR